MKATNKLPALAMAAAMALVIAAGAGFGAFAADRDIGTEESFEALSAPTVLSSSGAATFNVKVPTSIPLTIDAHGRISTPTDLRIENSGDSAVRVSRIEAAEGAWELVAYDADLSGEAVDANKLGLQLTAGNNSARTIASAADTQELAGFDASSWLIGDGQSLSIEVDAIATAVSASVSDVTAASIIFTVVWEDEDAVSAPTLGAPGDGADAPAETPEPTEAADTPEAIETPEATETNGNNEAPEANETSEPASETGPAPAEDDTRDGEIAFSLSCRSVEALELLRDRFERRYGDAAGNYCENELDFSFTAAEGMTWGEWLDDEDRNIAGFTFDPARYDPDSGQLMLTAFDGEENVLFWIEGYRPDELGDYPEESVFTGLSPEEVLDMTIDLTETDYFIW